MEESYLVVDFSPDIFVIDGSLRPQCIKLVDQHVHSPISRCRMIVVDNMESMDKYTEGKFPGFVQHDFPELDLSKIPAHSNGKWSTSVWLRKT